MIRSLSFQYSSVRLGRFLQIIKGITPKTSSFSAISVMFLQDTLSSSERVEGDPYASCSIRTPMMVVLSYLVRMFLETLFSLDLMMVLLGSCKSNLLFMILYYTSLFYFLINF